MIKAYRREALSDVHLYGEMHRFLPALCHWRGARLSELVVNHRPRIAGTTKYGLKRTIKVLFDLLTVKFLGDYLTKPLYFFGKLAMLTMVISFLSVGVAIAQKFGYLTEHGAPVKLNNNIFVLFAMMIFITTGMLMMAGVIAELLIRIYHESQGRTPYKVRQIVRSGKPSSLDLLGTQRTVCACWYWLLDLPCETGFDSRFKWRQFASSHLADARDLRGGVQLWSVAGMDDCHARKPGTHPRQTGRNLERVGVTKNNRVRCYPERSDRVRTLRKRI